MAKPVTYRRRVKIKNRVRNVNSYSISTVLKYLLYGAVIVFLFFVIKKLIVSFGVLFDKLIGTKNDELENQENKDYLDNAQNEIDKTKLTYSLSTYDSLAEGVYTALQGSFTEDEKAVYDVFKKIRTESDLSQLKVSYGIRPIGLIGFRTGMNLSQSIRALFSSSEVKITNYQLYKNKVKSRI